MNCKKKCKDLMFQQALEQRRKSLESIRRLSNTSVGSTVTLFEQRKLKSSNKRILDYISIMRRQIYPLSSLICRTREDFLIDNFTEERNFNEMTLFKPETNVKKDEQLLMEDKRKKNKLMMNGLWRDVESWCIEEPERAEDIVQTIILRNVTRCLPIHVACSMDPPHGTLQLLIQAHPESLKIRDSYYQSLPIHIACRTNTSPIIIRELLESNPESADYIDGEGNFPLHLACRYASHDVTNIVLEFSEDSFSSANYVEKKLPIHYICSRSDACLSLLMKVVQANFNGLSTIDQKGCLPIHLAITHHAPKQIVQYLLFNYPVCVFARNKDGKTPLDLALEIAGARSEVYKAVKSKYDKERRKQKIAKIINAPCTPVVRLQKRKKSLTLARRISS